MVKLNRIIVGHDLRAGGDAAFKSAMVLASRCDAAVRLVHTMEPHPTYQRLSHPFSSERGLEKIAKQVGAKLRGIVASRGLAQAPVDYELRVGKPFVELIIASRVWEAELIIIGGPSHHRSHFLGSTGERVIRKAPVPVLVAGKILDANPKRFLVPTDFSPGASKAAEEALALADSFGGRIFFLHVLEPIPLNAYGYEDGIGEPLPIPPLTPEDINPDWESFLCALPFGKISWEKRTEEGRAAEMIAQHAEAIHADMIVMGTHGRSGLEHMLLGSVAEEVTRSAVCPVLTIRPEAFEFKLP